MVGCSSGNWYQTKVDANEKSKRVRKAALSDEELLIEIKVVINESLFKGEGYRKIWHICKKGDRYAAMEPVRNAVRKVYGNVNKDVCKVH